MSTGTPTAALAARRPGRPRTGGLDRRVLDAVVDLLLESDRVPTLDAVTARSGVSRAAIYRRWPSLATLVAAALDTVRRPIAFPDTGSLLGDLLAIYSPGQHRAEGSSSGQFGRLVVRRIALGLDDPTIRAASWEQHVTRRRIPVVRAFEAAIRRGEIPADVDIEACIDLVAGVQYYQVVVRAPDGREQERIVRALRALCDGLVARAG